MAIISQLTNIMIGIIIAGSAVRIAICFIKMMTEPDESNTYKGRIKSTIIFAVASACVGTIKALAQYYFGG